MGIISGTTIPSGISLLWTVLGRLISEMSFHFRDNCNNSITQGRPLESDFMSTLDDFHQTLTATKEQLELVEIV